MNAAATPTSNEQRFQLFGANSDFFRDHDSRECLIAGAAGTGKTIACLLKLHVFALRYPSTRCLIVRKTRASLTETALVTYERDILGEDHWIMRRRLQRSHRHDYQYQNGSILVVGGIDRPDKILSSDWDLIFCSEATELSIDDWETLSGRLRTAAGPYDQIFGDCNPTSPHHWLKQRCEAGQTQLYTSKHWENPRYFDRIARKWTTEGWRYIQKRLQLLTGHRRQRFLEGVWAAAEGLVYQFESVHRLPRDWNPPRDWKRVWGIDWGERSPTVLGLFAINPATLGMYHYREVFKTHLRADVLGKWAKRWLDTGEEPRPVSVVCDHDPDKKLAFERETGLSLRMAEKADRDRGIQAMQARFDHGPGQPPRIFFKDDALDHKPDQLLLDEGRPCTAQAELSCYTWDPKFINDTPIEDNDHFCDLCRYVCTEIDKTMLKPGQQSAFSYDRSKRPGGRR